MMLTTEESQLLPRWIPRFLLALCAKLETTERREMGRSMLTVVLLLKINWDCRSAQRWDGSRRTDKAALTPLDFNVQLNREQAKLVPLFLPPTRMRSHAGTTQGRGDFETSGRVAKDRG